MKGADQILKLLAEHPDTLTSLTEKAIADACGTVPQNINAVLLQLVKDGMATRSKEELGWHYQVTDAGIARTQADDFGQEGRKAPATRPAAPDASPLSIGIFTTGELHVEANGKKLVLTKSQASELVEFVCALPNRLFATPTTAKAGGSAFPSMVHRLKDE